MKVTIDNNPTLPTLYSLLFFSFAATKFYWEPTLTSISTASTTIFSISMLLTVWFFSVYCLSSSFLSTTPTATSNSTKEAGKRNVMNAKGHTMILLICRHATAYTLMMKNSLRRYILLLLKNPPMSEYFLSQERANNRLASTPMDENASGGVNGAWMRSLRWEAFRQYAMRPEIAM